MNKKRLGQALIGGVFTVCGLVMAALARLVEKEETKPAGKEEKPEE